MSAVATSVQGALVRSEDQGRPRRQVMASTQRQIDDIMPGGMAALANSIKLPGNSNALQGGKPQGQDHGAHQKHDHDEGFGMAVIGAALGPVGKPMEFAHMAEEAKGQPRNNAGQMGQTLGGKQTLDMGEALGAQPVKKAAPERADTPTMRFGRR